MTRDGTAESVSRDQILRHEFERGQENIHFSCSADHVQDWQPYPVEPCSCYMCDHTISHVGELLSTGTHPCPNGTTYSPYNEETAMVQKYSEKATSSDLWKQK